MKVLFVYTNFNSYHAQTCSFSLASLVSIANQDLLPYPDKTTYPYIGKNRDILVYP